MPAAPSREELLRVAAVLAVAVSTVLATQLTKGAQTGLDAPLFVMIVHTGMMSICWIPAKALALEQPVGASKKDVFLLLPTWLASNYCFVAALGRAPAGLVQTLFGTAPAMVACLSVIFLKEPCTPARCGAVCVAFLGTFAVSSRGWQLKAWQGGNSTALGIVFALCAVVAAATYKVTFKRRFREPSIHCVLGCLASLGSVAGVLGLPAAVALSLLGVEDEWWNASKHVRWPLIFSSGLVDVVYNMAIAWGLALASPTLIAMGVILGIPLNLFIDAVCNHELPGSWETIGAIMIAVSFAVLSWRQPLDHGSDVSSAQPLTDA